MLSICGTREPFRQSDPERFPSATMLVILVCLSLVGVGSCSSGTFNVPFRWPFQSPLQPIGYVGSVMRFLYLRRSFPLNAVWRQLTTSVIDVLPGFLRLETNLLRPPGPSADSGFPASCCAKGLRPPRERVCPSTGDLQWYER